MSLTLILLLLAGGLLIIPILGGEDDEDDSGGGKNVILGGPEDDNITGTDGNDLIRTFLGNDTIDGGDGNDEIRAGDGDDIVKGGAGLDFIRGGAGNDEIEGNEGNDRILADRGDDFVDGGIGSDIIRGGAGKDIILGGIDSTLDADGRPIGSFGATDQLFGEDDDDLLVGWGTGTTLNGGTNNPGVTAPNDDTLVAVSGEVEMEGRTGLNTFVSLATLEDSQATIATVIDFDREDDLLVLTMDYTSTETLPADYEPEFEVTFVPADSASQGSGTQVTVTWTNPPTVGDTTSESARALLVSFTPDQLDGTGGGDSGMTLHVYLTEESAYADPLATLDDLDARDPDAVFVYGTPPPAV